jgi:hypothetical protein
MLYPLSAHDMLAKISQPAGDRKHSCPCCRFRTLRKRAVNEVCPICLWEDDGQDDHDADVQRHGPLFESLTSARLNFKEFGAHDLLYIGIGRDPLPEDIDASTETEL